MDTRVYDFHDLLNIDPVEWGQIDPLGLMTYAAYKRRKFHCESAESPSNVEELNEVLTPQQRMNRKMVMRRIAPKLARARKLAMKRRGGNDVLKRRAMGLARSTMARKLLGGRNKSEVSVGERARIEKILATRKKGVERLATRLISTVRQKQAKRFAHKRVKPGTVKKPAHTPPTKPASSPKPHPSNKPAKHVPAPIPPPHKPAPPPPTK